MELYRSRWGIQANLKKKGGNSENTHMTAKDKVDKLLAVPAFASVFTVGWGWTMREKITLNDHKRSKSAFLSGRDQLKKIRVNP